LHRDVVELAIKSITADTDIGAEEEIEGDDLWEALRKNR